MKFFVLIFTLALVHSVQLSAQGQLPIEPEMSALDRLGEVAKEVEGISERDLWTDDMTVEEWFAKHRPGDPVPDFSKFPEGHVAQLKDMHNRSIRARMKIPEVYRRMREINQWNQREIEALKKRPQLFDIFRWNFLGI